MMHRSVPMPVVRGHYSVPAVALLSALYVALYLPAFISYRSAPLLFVAFAPFALAVCGARNGAPAVIIVTAASAVLWFFGNLFFGAYNLMAVVALALVHACIIGACALAMRWWFRTTGLPLALLLPATWVAGEFLRLLGPIGVPTGLIALPFHDCLWMIQLADLGGVYAVSFAIAAVNGAIADVVLRTTGRRYSVAGVSALWLFVAGYGAYRLREARETMRPGPVIGVVQPDVPFARGVAHGFDAELFLEQMLALSDESAASDPRPQLIVWPEVMAVIPPINANYINGSDVPEERLIGAREFERALRDWTTRAGVPLLVGSYAFEQKSTDGPLTLYNSAIRFDPGTGQFPQRQDKQRLFPLVESIPWSGTAIHDRLKRWAEAQTSDTAISWYARGETRNVFELTAAAAAEPPLRYVVSMCVELCYAESCGTFLRNARGGKAADFLVNMSNDGIFQRNRALVLHASMSSFRAVEARVGVARSSNTGISGFVKPTGEMYGDVVNARGQSWTRMGAPELPRITALVKFRREHADKLASDPALAKHVNDEIAAIEQLRRDAGVSGQSTQRVYVDSRRTLYSRTGDWFSWALVIATACGILGQAAATIRRIRLRSA